MEIRGKRVLVTGGAHRLGRAAAEAFADEGADIAIHYYSSREEAETTTSSCRERGVDAAAYGADLSKSGEGRRLIERLEEDGRLPDILINSASIYRSNSFETVTREELENDAALTAYGPLELCRSFAERVGTGAIVNILDARMVDYDAKHLSYHLAKSLLFSITRILAVELAPHIRVNGIAPGIIVPPENTDAAQVEKFRRGNPLQRVGSPEEYAHTLIFLASADFITGDVLFLDGGRHLRGRMYGV